MCLPIHQRGRIYLRSTRTLVLGWIGPVLIAAVSIGCEDEVRPAGKRSATRALDQTGVAVGQDEAAGGGPAAVRPAPKQSGSIIGQRTSDIRNAATEVGKGDAKVVKPQITAKDYITLQGNAYAAIVGRTSVMMIQHAMDLYHATNDRYPKDYDEFMAEIIKANNIALPQLPPYQKYGYNDKEHKLVILEYPALKDQPPPR
jgi:hypothetical protein